MCFKVNWEALKNKATTDKACFHIELRQACFLIACYYLYNATLYAIILPGFFSNSRTIIGFVILVVANIALYFAAQWESKWLVLVWLIHAILEFITYPIVFLGVLFNFGGFRDVQLNNDVALAVLMLFISLVIFIFCTRYVFSYWRQLTTYFRKPNDVNDTMA